MITATYKILKLNITPTCEQNTNADPTKITYVLVIKHPLWPWLQKILHWWPLVYVVIINSCNLKKMQQNSCLVFLFETNLFLMQVESWNSMSDPVQNNKNKIINHILTLSIGFQKQYQANNKIQCQLATGL